MPAYYELDISTFDNTKKFSVEELVGNTFDVSEYTPDTEISIRVMEGYQLTRNQNGPAHLFIQCENIDSSSFSQQVVFPVFKDSRFEPSTFMRPTRFKNFNFQTRGAKNINIWLKSDAFGLLKENDNLKCFLEISFNSY